VELDIIKEASTCEGCCFAIESNASPNLCRIDRLNDIFEVCKDVTTDSNNMWVFDRACHYRRSILWEKDQKNKGVRALKEATRLEMRWKCDVIVYDESGDADEVRKTLNSIYNQEWAPESLWLVLNSNISQLDGLKLLKEAPAHIKVWRVDKIRALDFSFEESIDATARKLKAPWMVVIYSGEELPTDFFKTVDKSLNDNLDRYVLLVSDGYYAVSRTVFTLVGGNTSKDIMGEVEGSAIDKICWVANEEKNPGMVRRVNDIYE
jgi:hypothetical protein